MTNDDLFEFNMPVNNSSIIKVLGVGGGGGNAINHMFSQGIKDVDFLICNTDAQALKNSDIPVKIQLGDSLTEGRGAGNKPQIGKEAAIENIQDVKDAIGEETKMIFITAGMGGGTGTGAAPIIAEAAREMGILTVAIVTIPFRFEGKRRIEQAIQGISELSKHVDSLLVIHNEKLREVYGNLNLTDAFARADDVLTVAAKGIAEIITVHGHVNVDFADVQTVMKDSGVALMGSGTASGEDRAIKAIETALNSPLLNNNNITGAQNILLNIISGENEVTMDEIGEINEYVQQACGYVADLIWGNSKDPELGENISVTVIATGFDTDVIPEVYSFEKNRKEVKLQIGTKSVNQNTKEFNNIKTIEDPENPGKRVVEFENTDKDEHSDDWIETQDDKLKKQTFQTFRKKDPNEPHFKLIEQDGKIQVEPQDEIYPTDMDEIDEQIDQAQRIAQQQLERQRILREKLQQRNKKKREIYNKPLDESTIEEQENEPSYKRKGIKINDINISQSKKVSKVSLRETKDGIELNNDNSYLHDNVD